MSRNDTMHRKVLIYAMGIKFMQQTVVKYVIFIINNYKLKQNNIFNRKLQNEILLTEYVHISIRNI